MRDRGTVKLPDPPERECATCGETLPRDHAGRDLKGPLFCGPGCYDAELVRKGAATDGS